MNATPSVIRTERNRTALPRYFLQMDWTTGAIDTIDAGQRSRATVFPSARKANKQARDLRERFPSFRFIVQPSHP